MALIPWRGRRGTSDAPEAPLTRFRDEMDTLFDRFFRDPWGLSLGMSETLPQVMRGALSLDVSETDDEVTVTAEVPGIDPKELEISVSGNVLTIQGEKKEDREEKDRNYHLVERRYGRVHRSIQLPSYVDALQVDASFANGVLTIKLPKRPEAKARRIAVKSA